MKGLGGSSNGTTFSTLEDVCMTGLVINEKRFSHFGEDTSSISHTEAKQDSDHAAFLSKLFSNHCSKSNPAVKPGLTSLDMWEISDNQKLYSQMKNSREHETSFQHDADKYLAVKILRYRGDETWQAVLDEMINGNRGWNMTGMIEKYDALDTNMEEAEVKEDEQHVPLRSS
jgi:hypothetical protein